MIITHQKALVNSPHLFLSGSSRVLGGWGKVETADPASGCAPAFSILGCRDPHQPPIGF